MKARINFQKSTLTSALLNFCPHPYPLVTTSGMGAFFVVIKLITPTTSTAYSPHVNSIHELNLHGLDEELSFAFKVFL